MGTMIAAIQPSSVPAHWMPMFWNTCVTKSGKTKPTIDRIMVVAANVDAALHTLSQRSRDTLLVTYKFRYETSR